MKDIGDAKQCPHCGFFADSPQMMPYLPLRTVVGGRYLVGKLLDCNGDGATYIGWDITQKMPVYIREFLPDAIAQRDEKTLELKPMAGCEMIYRDCIQSFLELWRKLVRLRGLSALISAFDIVEDYSTAYAVSEYMEGITLRQYLLNTKMGYISWEQARALLMPVLSTLGNLHSAGILHRGISPTTLFIGKDNRVRITGFSIGQARTARGELSAELFPGYAAFEQYGFEGQQGAWTDIYAFAAVLYRSLIGSNPPEATARVTNDKMMIPGRFAEQIPAYVIDAMVNALQILPDDRTKTVEQLRDELSASPNITNNTGIDFSAPTNTAASAPVADKEELKKKQSKKTALKAALICVAVCLVVGAVLSLTVFRDSLSGIIGPGSDDNAESYSSAATVTVPNFVGQSYSKVTATASFTSRYNFTVQREYSKTVEEGYVISQSLPAYTDIEITEGKKVDITLVVSAGAEKIVMPDVVGKTYDEAVKLIVDAGLSESNIQVITKVNDGTKLNKSVASSTPSAGKECTADDKIVLQIWSEYTVN